MGSIRSRRALTVLLFTLGLVLGAGLPASAAIPACSDVASDSLVTALSEQAPRLERDILRLALNASSCAAETGALKRRDLLTVIDYSLPSTEPRLWVFDLAARKVLFEEHVAHGVNSGFNHTEKFSNLEGSRQTSLGLFVTQETYFGGNGYSLRLKGLDKGFNDRARERAIVMHGASYVNPGMARSQGRLGRSWGCPAVRSDVAQKMIDTVKNGTPIFAYYPDQRWLSTSKFCVR